MTYWNRYGTPLEVTMSMYRKSFNKFITTLGRNQNGELLWEINVEEQLWPISCDSTVPEDYLGSLIEIINWLKEHHINQQSSYSFSFVDHSDNRSAGAINTNSNGIKFCKLMGNGIHVLKEFDM